jgi:hypothetical protein
MNEMARFQVLAALGMKMTALCNIALCSMAEVDRRFRDPYCLHHQGDGAISKKSVIV